MSEPKSIGLGRYQFLKALPLNALKPDDIESIKTFESIRSDLWKPTEGVKKYISRVKSEPENVSIKIDPVKLAKSFLLKWEKMVADGDLKQALILTDEMKKNLRTLNYYLAGDERFSKGCEVELSAPDLRKGLLIIGPFGNGKTSSMSVYHQLLMQVVGYSFKKFTSTEVVDLWEACNCPEDKKIFWNQILTGIIHFDDILREREASNYGKVEIFRDILLKRYDLGLKTYLTCNSPTSNPSDALEAMADKYGEIVYDRLREMFNVVFWKGKSFRR